MKNIIRKVFAYSLVVTAMMAMGACEDDSVTPDFLDDVSNIDYSKQICYVVTEEINKLDRHASSLVLNDVDNSLTGHKSSYDFKVLSTKSASKDVHVSLAADTSEIALFNEANETKYVLLPTENYKVVNLNQTIPAGEKESPNMVSIELINPELLTATSGYILPLRMVSLEGGDNSAISTNKSVVYVIIKDFTVVSVIYDNLDFKGTTPLEGVTEIDRTDWSVESDIGLFTGSLSNAFDGMYNTITMASSRNFKPIYIDLKEATTPKGISLAAGYMYNPAYALAEFSISVSMDGEKWISYGEVTLDIPSVSSNLSNPDVQYVLFKTTKEARYIKFVPISAYNGYMQISEIKLYE